MDITLESKVQNEIEALHNFFVGWFSGVLPNNAFESEFLERFDRDFLLVPPAGTVLTLDDFQSVVRKAHGTNPDFRIAIRNVQVHSVLGSHIHETWLPELISSAGPYDF